MMTITRREEFDNVLEDCDKWVRKVNDRLSDAEKLHIRLLMRSVYSTANTRNRLLHSHTALKAKDSKLLTHITMAFGIVLTLQLIVSAFLFDVSLAAFSQVGGGIATVFILIYVWEKDGIRKQHDTYTLTFQLLDRDLCTAGLQTPNRGPSIDRTAEKVLAYYCEGDHRSASLAKYIIHESVVLLVIGEAMWSDFGCPESARELFNKLPDKLEQTE